MCQEDGSPDTFNIHKVGITSGKLGAIAVIGAGVGTVALCAVTPQGVDMQFSHVSHYAGFPPAISAESNGHCDQ